MIEVPVAVNPQVRLMNIHQVVQELTSDAWDIVLIHIFCTKNVSHHGLRAFMRDDDPRLRRLVRLSEFEELRVAKFLIRPPVEPLCTKVFIDRESTPNTENGIVKTSAVSEPKRVTTALLGVIMVSSDEFVVTL